MNFRDAVKNLFTLVMDPRGVRRVTDPEGYGAPGKAGKRRSTRGSRPALRRYRRARKLRRRTTRAMRRVRRSRGQNLRTGARA